MAHVSGQMELLYKDLRTPSSKKILTLWSTPFGKCFWSKRVAFFIILELHLAYKSKHSGVLHMAQKYVLMEYSMG